MDIKEKEAFEALQNPKVLQRVAFLPVANAYAVIDEYRDDLFTLEWCEELNFGWRMWQAAKALAALEKDAIIQKLSDQLYKQETKASAARVLCETACELLDDYAHQDAMVILNDLEQAMIEAQEPANE